jgi:AraC-like DNA-binding protein
MDKTLKKIDKTQVVTHVIRHRMENLFDYLKIELLTAEQTVLGPEWSLNRYDPYARLYTLLEGSAWVVHHTKRYLLRPGWLYLIPAHTWMRTGCPARIALYWVHFNARLFGSLDLFKLFHPKYSIRIRKPGRTMELFHPLITKRQPPSPITDFERDLALRSLVLEFLRTADIHNLMARLKAVNRFGKVMDYMDKNLARKMTLQELASLEGLNPCYFSNQFKEHIGLSVMRYLNQKRIEKAQELLWSTSKKLEVIAAETGFEDAFYFSRFFRKVTGVPPIRYRNASRMANDGQSLPYPSSD